MNDKGPKDILSPSIEYFTNCYIFEGPLGPQVKFYKEGPREPWLYNQRTV